MKYLKRYEELNESSYIHNGITQENALKLIEQAKDVLCELFDIKEDSITHIGSAGKLKDPTDLSRNINFVIDKKMLMKKNKLNEETYEDFVSSRLNMLEMPIRKEDHHFVVTYPYGRKQADVHCNITNDYNWVKFSRYCPNLRDGESDYSTKYRQAVYHAIASNINPNIVSYLDENDNVKEFESYHFDVHKGLEIRTNSFVGKTGVLKKAVVLEETKQIVDNNPKSVIKTLFGKEYRPEDVMTFESCLKAIKSDKFAHKKKRKRIMESLRKELINLKLKIPEKL